MIPSRLLLALCVLCVVERLPARLASSAEPELRDLNSHCPFTPPDSLEAWEARAKNLHLQLKVSLGLAPNLNLDPVQPNIYGRIERDGYAIEKVTFESLPGFFVTGNLYRPSSIPDGSTVPGILCPHGHWQDARFYEASPNEVKQLLATGAERFETAARNHIQARCVQLARMGCIVFHWDMIGYCDSTQISFDRAHRFSEQSAASEVSDDGWLLFSPLAEAHCQSVLGMQTLAIQRAVDMLLSLPEIDSQRIAITGASGGGTQSFLGAALDERINVAFPAVMVSTGMQGGCTCENACLLRIGTSNVEMAGLFAPKPIGLTAADDWTKTMPQDGFPELRRLYKMMDAERNVALFPAVHFGHNFNHVSRTNMYGWMSQHLGLGFDRPVLERDFELAQREELSVWDSQHPKPVGGEDFERSLMKLWAEIVDRQMTTQLQGDRDQVEELASILKDGWRVCLGLTAPTEPSTVTSAQLQPLSGDQPTPPTITVTIGTGDEAKKYSLESLPTDPQPLVSNPRLAAAYTYGYNLPAFAKESQRLATALNHLQREYPEQAILIRAAGPYAALAAAGVFCASQMPTKPIDPAAGIELIIAPENFSFADAETIRSFEFLPGAAKYWDLPGLVSCLNADVKVAVEDSERFMRLSGLIQVAGGELDVMRK